MINNQCKAIKLFCLMLVFILALTPMLLNAASTYTSTWASVDKHLPAPEWYKDAKLGIFFHWGAYTVPGFANEWYPKYIYDKTTSSYDHHLSTYGDPFGDWGYNNFFTGKNDKKGNFVQFAPKLKSAGGKFDPEEFGTVIAGSGARYAGPVTEHHDGFSMWDSKVNEWCATKTGPQIDLYKLLTDAMRAKNVKVVASFHHAYNFTGFYSEVPAQSDSSLKKLFGQLGTTAENQLWYDKIKEVIDGYQPDIIWHDFNIRAVNSTQVLNSLAYYYNKAIDWNKEVVVNWKDGMNNNGEVYDYERRMPADITTPYWEAHFGVSGSTWAWRSDMSYYDITGLLHFFIDIVSKGGNLLLNFGPMPDGTIPTEAKDRLSAFGDWLGKFGETIYATRTWTVYGEGPTQLGTTGTSYLTPKAGTKSDIRYTLSKDKNNLYAIFLAWPGNGIKVTLAKVTSSAFALGSSAKVYLYGTTPSGATSLTFSQSGSGLQVTFPSTQPYTARAYALKIAATGEAPKGPPEVAVDPDRQNSAIKQVNRRTNASINRMYFNGGSVRSCLKIPENAVSVEIYTLQGKRLFTHAFSESERGIYKFDDFKKASSQTCFVKFSRD